MQSLYPYIPRNPPQFYINPTNRRADKAKSLAVFTASSSDFYVAD